MDCYSEDKILSITQSLGEKIVLQMAPYEASLLDRPQRKLPTLDFRLRTNMISDTDGLTEAVYLTKETAELARCESPLSHKLTRR